MSYEPGTEGSYGDANATVSDGLEGVATGVVNGPPITDDSGEITHVPVYTDRDNGREATTVYVAVANILTS